DPDAGLALGDDWIREPDGVDSALEQLGGEVGGQSGVAEHDRDDGMSAWADVEARGGHLGPEPLGVFVQTHAQIGALAQELEHRQAAVDDRRRYRVGEQVWT